MKKLVKVIVAALCLCVGISAFAACGTATEGFDAEQNIQVVTREWTSGTRTAFMELIGLKGKDDPSRVIVTNSTSAVMGEVETNYQAIAFESLGYCTDAVKLVNIDGVEPTVANIIAGTYKISRPLSIIYRDEVLEDAARKTFRDYLMSADAQKIISDEGYVSLNAGTAYTKIEMPAGTVIDVTGSTSLQPLMEVLAVAFETLYGTAVDVKVGGGGSGTGRTDAKDGTKNIIGMISDTFTADDDATLTCDVVAKDGIAVIVNKENPITNLTSAQIKNVYDKEATGANKYTKWSDIK